VASLFEDAVLDVRHFTNPQSGKVSSMTKGLLGGGAAALLGAFIVFVIAYVQTAHFKNQWEEWDKAGQPHSDFLATLPNRGREGPGLDIAVTVLFALGLYGTIHGMVRRFDEMKPRDYTIGTEKDALFNVPGELLPVASFPLVRSTGTDYELNFTAQMK